MPRVSLGNRAGHVMHSARDPSSMTSAGAGEKSRKGDELTPISYGWGGWRRNLVRC